MADLTTSNSIDLYEALRRLLALFETLDEPSGVRVVDAARAELTHLRERVAELEGVVERLPKTADGVRVLPGDKVYWPWTSSGRPLELTCQSRCSASAIGTGSEPMCECYSTPEAAALASEGGRG